MNTFETSTITYSIQHDHACALKKDKKRKMTKKQKKEMVRIFKFQHVSIDDEENFQTKVRKNKKVISQSRKKKRNMKHNYLFEF